MNVGFFHLPEPGSEWVRRCKEIETTNDARLAALDDAAADARPFVCDACDGFGCSFCDDGDDE